MTKTFAALLVGNLALGALALSAPPACAAPPAPSESHAAAGGWKTPFPPYPADARLRAEQGRGELRVRTGAKGRVVEATMIKSTGSKRLDEATVVFVRTYWEGPPNAERYVVLNYRLKRKAGN